MPERIKVLVVDDEQVMRNLLTDILTDAGYKVKAVATGEKAVEEVGKDDFAVVITDYKMPGMNGLEVIKKVKQINADLCLIVITAYPSVESAVEAMREGAYDYIIKPFNIQEIKLVLHRAVERHHLLKEAEKKEFYRELSTLDGLTGIYNHRYFHEVLSREIERSKFHKRPFCLLIIDLDNFKHYNDTYGHMAGDSLLQDFARFLVGAVRDVDMVFRYGGDEFAVICPEIPKQVGIEIAERTINLAKQKLPITVSIGLSCFPDDASEKNRLIEKTDQALYQAKRLGGNRICIFGKDEDQRIKILVVDDEHVMRSLFTDLLGDQGYEVSTVSNGKEAIKKVKENFYHIAFIDIHMPVMNGIETLRAIKKISPKTAVIMMDSFPDALVEESQEQGAATCLHKPFSIHEITDLVKQILKQ